MQERNYFDRKVLNFLLLFVVVFIPIFTLLSFFVNDFLSTIIFGSNEFQQFVYQTFSNYIYIFIVFSLIPYVSFILIATIVLVFIARTNFKISKLFWLIVISMALAFLFHVIYVYAYFEANIDVVLEDLGALENVNLEEFTDLNTLISVIAEITFLQEYRDSGNVTLLILYYFFSKLSGIGSKPFILYDQWLIFAYFLIIFSILFILFHESCSCNLKLKVFSKKAINVCSKREILVILITIAIVMLPVINLVQLWQNLNRNYLDWNEYYDLDSASHNIYATNSSNEINTTFVNQTAKMQLVNDNFTIKQVSGFNHEINFISGSDLVYSRLWEFNETKQANKILFNHVRLTSNFTKGLNSQGWIWQNHTGFWDNVELYVYAIENDNSTAYGYRLDNEESFTKQDHKKYNFTEPNLASEIELQAFNLNISANFEVLDLGGLFPIARTMVNVKPKFIFDVDTTTLGLGQEEDFLEFGWDESLIVFQNWLGYYDIPLMNAKYFGIYLKINASADLDFDNDGYNEVLTLFEDNAYIGKQKSITDTLLIIQYTDIIYILATIGLTALVMVLDNRDKSIEGRTTLSERRNQCEGRKIKVKFDRKYS